MPPRRAVWLRLTGDDPNLREAMPPLNWWRHSLESSVMRSGKASPYRTDGGKAEGSFIHFLRHNFSPSSGNRN